MPYANITHSVEHYAQSVLKLTDSSSDELLESVNEQAKKMRLWPFVGVGLLLLFLWGRQFMTTWPTWVWVSFGLGAALTAWVRHRDQLKLGKPSRLVGQVPSVVANVDVPVLTSGRTTLAFFPDRVLAFQGNSVGAVSYADVNIESFPARYIEHESVPSYASVVGHTWQFVNKKGGPDKRFKNNRQLPVCQVSRLHLSSSRGLDVRLMASRDGAFDEFARAVQQFSKLR